MIVYLVGYIYENSRSADEIHIVAAYSEPNKQKADELRQKLQQANKGDSQFVNGMELDPVSVSF